MPRLLPPSLMLLLLLCALPAVPARAADVAFSGVLPNGALYYTPVESMRESRFRHLVRQQTVFDDQAVDTLLGGGDLDWFLLSSARDRVLDKLGSESTL